MVFVYTRGFFERVRSQGQIGIINRCHYSGPLISWCQSSISEIAPRLGMPGHSLMGAFVNTSITLKFEKMKKKFSEKNGV